MNNPAPPKIRVPQLTRKNRTIRDLDPESLTAALNFRELVERAQLVGLVQPEQVPEATEEKA